MPDMRDMTAQSQQQIGVTVTAGGDSHVHFLQWPKLGRIMLKIGTEQPAAKHQEAAKSWESNTNTHRLRNR